MLAHLHATGNLSRRIFAMITKQHNIAAGDVCFLFWNIWMKPEKWAENSLYVFSWTYQFGPVPGSNDRNHGVLLLMFATASITSYDIDICVNLTQDVAKQRRMEINQP